MIQCPILWYAKVCTLPSARSSLYKERSDGSKRNRKCQGVNIRRSLWFQQVSLPIKNQPALTRSTLWESIRRVSGSKVTGSNHSGLLRNFTPSTTRERHVLPVSFTWWQQVYYMFSPPVIPLVVCVSSSALAKRTKASTQPCVWTRSSTSPRSWTRQWSVNAPWKHAGSNWGSFYWCIPS